MKKILLVVLCQLFISSKLFSQAPTNTDYRNCIKEFYKILFENKATIGELSKIYANGGIHGEAEQIVADSLKSDFYDFKLIEKKKITLNDASPSFIIKDFKPYSLDLTQGLNLTQLKILIDGAKIYNQGGNFDDYLELDFPNGKKVYFDLGIETPVQISWIWLNNGDLLEGKMYDNIPQRLYLVGSINDKDGYVNVRAKPSATSSIVDKFTKDEFFYYVPDGTSEWWPVNRKGLQNIIGYVHKSRVKNYVDFSEEMKNRVINARNK